MTLQTDIWTAGRTDKGGGGYHNIPMFFSKSAGIISGITPYFEMKIWSLF